MTVIKGKEEVFTMKNIAKRAAALLCVLVMVMSMAVMSASAYTYRTPSRPSGNKNQVVYIHSGLNPSKVVNVNGNYNRNGTKIQLWNQSSSDKAVKFTLRSAGNGWYYIMKYGTNKCLDVTGGKQGSGVNVQLYEYNGTAAQRWRMMSNGSSSYCYLKNALGYYLDAQNGSSSNGTQLWVYSYNGTNAQKWFVTPDWKMTWWN